MTGLKVQKSCVMPASKHCIEKMDNHTACFETSNAPILHCILGNARFVAACFEHLLFWTLKG